MKMNFIRNAKLKTKIMCIVAVLSAVALWSIANYFITALENYRKSNRLSLANAVSDDFLYAAGQQAIERGATATVLSNPQDVESFAKISGFRNEGDSRLDSALSQVRKLIVSDPSSLRKYDELAAVRKRRDEFRLQCDAFLGRSTALPDFTSAWISVQTDLIMKEHEFSMSLFAGTSNIEKILQFNSIVKSSIFQASEFAGRERANIGSVIGSGEPIDAGRMAALTRYRVIVDENIRSIIGLKNESAATPEIKAAIEVMAKAFLADFEQVRRDVYAASANKSPYPLTTSQWIDKSTYAINSILGVSEAISRESQVLAADENSHNLVILSLSMGMGLFLLAVFVCTLCVIRSITKPLQAIMGVAVEISRGNLAQKQLEISQKDEIGELAEIFNTMLCRLNKLLKESEQISCGVIGSDNAEKKIQAGMDIEDACKCSNTAEGDLEKVFQKMRVELCKLTLQARRIAGDDLANPLLDIRIQGELGEAFYQMTNKLRNLAGAARRISDGDIAVEIEARSGREVLANAFNKLVSSTKEMVEVASKMSDGDLTVNVKPRSEKDALAAEFRRMLGNLNELIQTINKQSQEVSMASDSLASIADQSSKNSIQLSQSIEQIAKAGTEVARSAQTASTASLKAQELSRQGRISLQEMLQKVESIKNSMDLTVSNIRKLAERSNDISEMMTVITDISEQTNLLSLNAAIEAARAGEAGRGFAVVATEIRKLADSSQKQAHRISAIIQDILSNTKDTQEVTNRGAMDVSGGVTLIESTHKLFMDIIQHVDSIASQMEQIAANAEETSAATEEVSAQSEEQAASVEEMSSSAYKLKSAVNTLNQSVVKFKVK